MALVHGPRLLLMDEPTAGMAPGERHQVMDLVAEFAARDGIAVLFTEHDMDIVFGHAGRVLVMSRGRLIAQGEPARSAPTARGPGRLSWRASARSA